MDKRVSYGVMRPGLNTLVGRVLFRICENWIGVGEFGGGVRGSVWGCDCAKVLDAFCHSFY